jgi:hypothetical protein
MSMPDAPDDPNQDFVLRLGDAIKVKTEDLIRQDDLDPIIGPLSMIVTARFISQKHNRLGLFVQVSDAIVKHRHTLNWNGKGRSLADRNITEADMRACERVGRLLLPMIEKRCGDAGYTWGHAIGALLTVGVEIAAEIGYLNGYHTRLAQLTPGIRRLLDQTRKPN